jgi:hypothetical protein
LCKFYAVKIKDHFNQELEWMKKEVVMAYLKTMLKLMPAEIGSNWDPPNKKRVSIVEA